MLQLRTSCASIGAGRRARGRLTLFAGLVLLLPALLSPTHPIAVYGYLAASYFPAFTRPVYADAGDGLADFLRSPAQVERYREELLADMADTNSGKLFAIVRGPGGRLAHAPICTWNSFLPEALPGPLRNWLDRKELPWLADEVALWQRGEAIVAMGHYHAFGGGPSSGDRLAQRLSDLPEVVVSNGVVPTVYLRGALLPYGDVEVSPEVLRSMRALERSLTMEIGSTTEFAAVPGPALVSFLAYLRDQRDVRTESRQEVAREVMQLCDAFKAAYRPCFEGGYTMTPYAHSPDKMNLIQNLAALHAWADIYEDVDETL